MDIISNANMDYKIVRSKFDSITEKLGTILRIPKESVLMLKPLKINNGTQITFLINTNSYKEMNKSNDASNKTNNFEEILNSNRNKQGLINEINESWKLSSQTYIDNINIHYKESKMRKRIELQNVNTNTSDDDSKQRILIWRTKN